MNFHTINSVTYKFINIAHNSVYSSHIESHFGINYLHHAILTFVFSVLDETSLRIAPDLSSSAYTRGTPPTGTTRKQLVETYSREDKGNNKTGIITNQSSRCDGVLRITLRLLVLVFIFLISQ